MRKISKYTIGADIEWFLKNKRTNEIVSAENIIKGSKTDPFRFDENNKFYATSLDNVMAEGNIPPADNVKDFLNSITKLADYINTSIPEDLCTTAIPSARLNEKFLQTENAMVFGCDPSWNCWSLEEIHPIPKGDNCRSAGFHVHIGYENPDGEVNIRLAKAMDLFLGIPSILMEPTNERRAVGYGGAGNFRHQKHGMEYRSLSSHFASSGSLMKWTYEATEKAIAFVNADGILFIDNLGEEIQTIINEEDVTRAKEYVERFNLQLAEA